MKTVKKFVFTSLFFLCTVCAFAQTQDTTVISAQNITVAPPDSLLAGDSLQVADSLLVADTVPVKKTKI